MPIYCPLTLAGLLTEEFGSLDYTVMRHVFASQNTIGRLADERVYRADVAQRLGAVGIPANQEVPIELVHKSFAKTLYLDLVVYRKAVYELKVVGSITDAHVAQLLTYLYLLDLPRGKLVNCRPPLVKSLYVNAPIPRDERCHCLVSNDGFLGDHSLLQLVGDLVHDWGTCLSVSLYHQAIVHLLGGEQCVDRMLPLTHDGRHLANQRFYMLDDDNAFDLTAFTRLDDDYYTQLQRLLNASPLRAIHWINIAPHEVACKTLTKP